MWTGEKLEMNSRGLLRDSPGARRNKFTVGKRAPSGGNPGDAGKAGKPVFAVGAWPWRSGAQRRGGRATGRSGAAWPDKAPFISYMKGALLHSAGRLGSKPDRHAGQTPPARSRQLPTARLDDAVQHVLSAKEVSLYP